MGSQLSKFTSNVKISYFQLLWRIFDIALSRQNRMIMNTLYYVGAKNLPQDFEDGTTLLIRNALIGDELKVQLLVEQYPNQINLGATGGQACLHAAATNGNVKICSILCNNGADINLRTDRKHTALMIACSLDHTEFVKEILNNQNANPDLCDIDMKTCQHFALKSLEITKLLINKTNGRLLKARDNNGKTPLTVAFMLKVNHDIIQFILNSIKKYNLMSLINSQSNDGMTPLMHACTINNVKTTNNDNDDDLNIIEQLLNDYDADCELRDAYGQTVLHLVSKLRYYKIVKILTDSSTSTSDLSTLQDDDGLLPIHAISTGLLTSKTQQEGHDACKCMEILLLKYPNSIYGIDFSDTTVLHLLVQGIFNSHETNSSLSSSWVQEMKEPILRMFTMLIHHNQVNDDDNVLLMEDESGWSCLHYMYEFIHLTFKNNNKSDNKNDDDFKNDKDDDIKDIKEEEEEIEEITIRKPLINLLEKSISKLKLKSIQNDIYSMIKPKKAKSKYLLQRGAYHRIPIEDRNNVLQGEQTLENIAKKILRANNENNSSPTHKIVVLCGAGISTSSGIPDYRSKTGIYNTKDGKDAFSNFHSNPKQFWEFARKTFGPIFQDEEGETESGSGGRGSGRIKPTPCHYFLSELYKKNMLQRVYTQNVDGLEVRAGIPQEKVIQCHGTINTVICSQCSQFKPTSSTPFFNPPTSTQSEDDVEVEEALQCPHCGSPLRPDVTFFGEPLSSSFFMNQDYDFNHCTMLIVMGTTLQVYPFAGLLNKTSLLIPRLLINKELTGPFRSLNDGNHKFRDVAYLGTCDEGVKELAHLLGWNERDWLSSL